MNNMEGRKSLQINIALMPQYLSCSLVNNCSMLKFGHGNNHLVRLNTPLIYNSTPKLKSSFKILKE